MQRYLTKSRFKLALDCPAKLFYTGKSQYPDKSQDDAFLEALAEGGFQVGALAKCYYPDGIEITERGYDIPLQKTQELLSHGTVTIFEGAFKYQNLFIRADIIEKKGNDINLLEVKSSSFGGTDSSNMLTKKGFIDSGWSEYVYDVAFQKYVITKAYPNWNVRAYLMLADKNSVATVDGLNQKFLLKTVEDERTVVEIVGDVSPDGLGEEVLIRVCVDALTEKIFNGTDSPNPPEQGFTDYLHYLADMYERDEKIVVPIHKDCKVCEFQATPEQEKVGKLSGFTECWKAQLNWDDAMFDLPRILDIWDFRKKQDLMDSGIYLMRDVEEEHIGDIEPSSDGKLTRTERQWLQVRKTVENDTTPYINIKGLEIEFKKFTYPLHFIDFETSMVAIPFFRGRRPYEQVAFQFSHHIVHSDLTIEHKGQYLSDTVGMFPNFEFVRRLKAELENDNGTIFRYAPHENTVLNQIMAQLNEATPEEVPDKQDLVSFIKSITHGNNHEGARDMVDLLKLVKWYYYHLRMRGSNSLKYVLPAVLNSSEYLQNKYSQPIYGKNSHIKSLNYDDDWVWLRQNADGNIINPYELLPPLFEGIDDNQIEQFLMKSNIQEGGAAMTAYARMQFMQMSDLERYAIASGLLKYCELDTLAMVMLWEYWNMCQIGKSS
ncbi:MAG: DUF2779 domain-containing protein [Prolixibacteraceae bacterium]|nr:DUF2779 domain-containing protein [Prolixibacteraceae bacterium]